MVTSKFDLVIMRKSFRMKDESDRDSKMTNALSTPNSMSLDMNGELMIFLYF